MNVITNCMTGVNQSKKRGAGGTALFLHFMNETVRRKKVMEKKEYYIPSKDGIHRLHVVLWGARYASKSGSPDLTWYG